VITNRAGQVLLARRPEHVHQGGLWEFPGGKLESGEGVEYALVRELHEELGLIPTVCRPLIRIRHDYPDKSVLLDVWRVDAWEGEPHGREGQPIQWVAPEALPARAFPLANRPIITAARLPDRYLITPGPGADEEPFLAGLERCLDGGTRLVQFRAKSLSDGGFRRLAGLALERCRRHGARLLLNSAPELVAAIGAHGVHLSGERLRGCGERPLGAEHWVAASCHNPEEVAHACRIGVDFLVVSPVAATASHPGAAPMGWSGLQALTERSTVPVYGLGGMATADLEMAWQHGAQGIAAIRGLWGDPDP